MFNFDAAKPNELTFPFVPRRSRYFDACVGLAAVGVRFASQAAAPAAASVAAPVDPEHKAWLAQ